MYVVTRNGDIRAIFSTRRAAIQHRDSMERVSLRLGRFRDRWEVRIHEEDGEV